VTSGRVYGRPVKVDVDGDGVDGADEQLDAELKDATETHGDTPVIDTVVDLKQLHSTEHK